MRQSKEWKKTTSGCRSQFEVVTYLPIPSCLAELAFHIFAFNRLAVPLEQHRRAEAVEKATTTMALPATTERLAFCADGGLNEVRSLMRHLVAKRARKPIRWIMTSTTFSVDRVCTCALPIARCKM